MSTSFEVYPSTTAIPSFAQVLSLAEKYLQNTLERYNIHCVLFKPDFCIMKNVDHTKVPCIISKPARWNKDEYAWFTIGDKAVGCDVSFGVIDELAIECWNDIFQQNKKAEKFESEIRKCLDTGIHWSFRRSIGQPEIINLYYGLLAASFASLTDGFIYSDDSAWEYALFPAKADEFLQSYFNPQCNDKNYGTWAKECLNRIREELRN